MLYPLCSNNKQNLSYEIINVCKYISRIFQSLWYSELCLGISRSPKQRFVCYLRHKFHTKFAPRSPRRCLVCKSCWKLGRSAFPSPSLLFATQHNPISSLRNLKTQHVKHTSNLNRALHTFPHCNQHIYETSKLNTLASPQSRTFFLSRTFCCIVITKNIFAFETFGSYNFALANIGYCFGRRGGGTAYFLWLYHNNIIAWFCQWLTDLLHDSF